MEQFLEIPYKLWQGKGCSGMFFYKRIWGGVLVYRRGAEHNVSKSAFVRKGCRTSYKKVVR